MKSDDTIARAIADVAEALNCSENALDRHSRLGSCPEWDSLAQLKIMLALEQKYGEALSEFKPEDLFSIQGVAKMISTS